MIIHLEGWMLGGSEAWRIGGLATLIIRMLGSFAAWGLGAWKLRGLVS